MNQWLNCHRIRQDVGEIKFVIILTLWILGGFDFIPVATQFVGPVKTHAVSEGIVDYGTNDIFLFLFWIET